jgi:hypothetical protein
VFAFRALVDCNGLMLMQVLAEMAACDESMALQAQHDAAKSARVAMAAEEARAAAEVDLALLHRELQQAAALQAAALQQRLRALAERAAKTTATALDMKGQPSATATEAAENARQSAAEQRDAVGAAAQQLASRIEEELQRLEEGAGSANLTCFTCWLNLTQNYHDAIPAHAAAKATNWYQ